MKKIITSIIILIMFAVFASGCVGKSNAQTWQVGDYKGYYSGLRLEDEKSDHPIVCLKFDFTNNSDEPISFDEALAPTAFQDGTELVRIDEEIEVVKMPVAPGETLSMDLRFYLIDLNELVEVRITNQKTKESYSVKNYCQ